jgi:hypothetical protein
MSSDEFLQTRLLIQQKDNEIMALLLRGDRVGTVR